jgi:ribosomal protein S19
VVACAGRNTESGNAERRTETTLPARSIDEVLAAHTDSLMRVPGVVGTAVGLCEGAHCIKVFVTDSSIGVKAGFPRELEGYPISVEVSGPFRPR